MVLSKEPEANTLPSGDQAMQRIDSECPVRVCIDCPVCMSQRRIVLSLEPEASTLPSGDQAMWETSPECPRSVCRSVKPGGMVAFSSCGGCCFFVRFRGIEVRLRLCC